MTILKNALIAVAIVTPLIVVSAADAREGAAGRWWRRLKHVARRWRWRRRWCRHVPRRWRRRQRRACPAVAVGRQLRHEFQGRRRPEGWRPVRRSARGASAQGGGGSNRGIAGARPGRGGGDPMAAVAAAGPARVACPGWRWWRSRRRRWQRRRWHGGGGDGGGYNGGGHWGYGPRRPVRLSRLLRLRLWYGFYDPFWPYPYYYPYGGYGYSYSYYPPPPWRRNGSAAGRLSGRARSTAALRRNRPGTTARIPRAITRMSGAATAHGRRYPRRRRRCSAGRLVR